jgi:hypothetical protein
MFRRLTLKGITLDDFKETFGVSRKSRETEKEALFRVAKANKGKKEKLKRKRV